MARQTSKRQNMDRAAIQARLADARKFLEAAEMYVEENAVSSWKVGGSNAVNAGIAASDVICGVVLGHCSRSANHSDAMALLEEATQPDAAPRKHLGALLADKSSYQYGTDSVRRDAAQALVEHAAKLIGEAERRAKR
ncbi:hypothetical protein E3O55_09860 [Cryobacterium sp. MDB1-18-2]|uniref:hypothetical protein n=1 Tax=unclassified Cryobacterium TaxID=2649013 RepID=UPI00106B01C5|nr:MULTISPECIES: hypothetical protein [unclassified Cryobacterium]TFC29170.1 hypothetical protein E3O55_09860 [Cryobacterium sp. MDB1-18-2]TFC45532.1 hypothetical protein E3O50_03530 [Cryobacterium sp. MDB1-18-1]